VYVENVERLSDYDVFAKAGEGDAGHQRNRYRFTVTDGILNLFFAKGNADLPVDSAIESFAVCRCRPAPARGRQCRRPPKP
jgi:hypothetical protein